MVQKNILTEVNRVREIMGLSLLNEGGIPGLAGDFVRNVFGQTVEEASGKLRNVIGGLGGAIDDALADEIMDAFPRLLDDMNTWDTLSDTVRKGFMRAFREIPEISTEIYNNLLKKMDVSEDELAGAIDQMIYEGRKQGIELDYDAALAKLLNEEGVSLDAMDIISKNNRKIYDDLVSSGSNIVSPLTKRITSAEEALKLIEVDLGFPLAKLRKIEGMNKILNDAANAMIGKTIGETKKMTEEALAKITSNAKFKEAWVKYTNTPWENGKLQMQKILDFFVTDYEQTGGKLYWPFGGEDILDAAGNKKISIPRSALKTAKSFIAISFVTQVFDKWYNEGMSAYEAVTSELHEAWVGIAGFIGSEIFSSIQQARDEAGELTKEQAISSFSSTAEQLGKSIEEYDFTKIKRGVWRAVDFSDDPQDYAIIRHSGETHIMPWTSDLDGYSWDNLNDDWDKLKDKVTSSF
jgi:hypothetical protein